MMKIWYDVSGIYSWKGSFTGIQRIVYNLGKELTRQDKEAKFFVFRHGTFQEVSFAEIESRLKQQPKVSAKRVDTSEKIQLSSLHHHMMVNMKSFAKQTLLEKPLRLGYANARNAYRSIRDIRSNRARFSTIFTKGDRIIIVDGNWQFPGYAEALKLVHQAVGIKIIHFVHDLTPIINPALASKGADKILGEYFEKIFPLADLLIADSESTQRDIDTFAKRLGMKKINRKVLIPGDNFGEKKTVEAKSVNLAFKNFILAVSTIEIRKNYTAFYYVYKLAKEKGIDLPNLVIVGRKGWMAEEAYALLTKDPELRDKVTILQGISDDELSWLYKNCLFTVFPSFYEGWGMPIAESFAHGKACISSNTSSMPEVGKDLAVYVSPYDINQLLETIGDLAADRARRESLEDNIRAVFKARSWHATCSEMMKIVG